MRSHASSTAFSAAGSLLTSASGGKPGVSACQLGTDAATGHKHTRRLSWVHGLRCIPAAGTSVQGGHTQQRCCAVAAASRCEDRPGAIADGAVPSAFKLTGHHGKPCTLHQTVLLAAASSNTPGPLRPASWSQPLQGFLLTPSGGWALLVPAFSIPFNRVVCCCLCSN